MVARLIFFLRGWGCALIFLRALGESDKNDFGKKSHLDLKSRDLEKIFAKRKSAILKPLIKKVNT